MNKNLLWIYLLITQCAYVASRPANDASNIEDTGQKSYNYQTPDEQVISVRITSSVAVGRGRGKIIQKNKNKTNYVANNLATATPVEDRHSNEEFPNLSGANIEFIKQLNAKKERNYEQAVPFNPIDIPHSDNEHKTNLNDTKNDEINNVNDKVAPTSVDAIEINEKAHETEHSPSILDDALKLSEERTKPEKQQTEYDTHTEYTSIPDYTDEKDDINDYVTDNLYNEKQYNNTDDSIAEPSIKSVLEIVNKDNENYENIENVPLARSVLQSPSSKNYIQGFTNKPPSEREPSVRLTTVSFNVVHDPPKPHNIYEPAKPYTNTHGYTEQQKFYEPQKIYSQPAQIYSEPAKFYSEPAKIYSEPAKVYSEPAKIYSEPAKIYSEPAKFYSEPASLHLNTDGSPDYSAWRQSPTPSSTTIITTPYTTLSVSELTNTQRIPEHQAEKNYEVDEKVSVLTDGRSHGVQESTTEKCKQDNCKVGYVVKGREYNKYRVEERTSDGFIVGEYGVVRNEDGALRGVRYTADSEASPRLIYDALMKFLQLK